MTAGRRPRKDRPVYKRINIPESVCNEVEILLANPLTGEPRYGVWGHLVTQLLKDWLETKRRPRDETRAEPQARAQPVVDLHGPDSAKPQP